LKTLEEIAKGKKHRELMELYRKIQEGKLRIEDPNPPKDFVGYLGRMEYSAWLWTSLSIAFLTLASIALSGYSQVFSALRYILGTLFVLFLPGYSTVEALYPKDEELSDLERLALSIGLSLALVPLIGLILNYTPWGIRLGPVAASLSAYTAAVSFVASYRKYSLFLRSRVTLIPPQAAKPQKGE